MFSADAEAGQICTGTRRKRKRRMRRRRSRRKRRKRRRRKRRRRQRCYLLYKSRLVITSSRYLVL